MMINEKDVRNDVLDQNYYDIFPLAAIFGTPIYAQVENFPYFGGGGSFRNFDFEISVTNISP